jgi:MerR family transcriptional regulator, light-induced transcriptional regulator
VAEGTGLENRHTGNGIESSNLSLSVRWARRHPKPVAPASCFCRKDGWPSGLRRTPGKRVGGQPSREFESRPIRESPTTPSLGSFLLPPSSPGDLSIICESTRVDVGWTLVYTGLVRKADELGSGGLHPIAVVAARTGLSTDVLRVWERRYQVVSPTRAPDGQRLYTDADVERLRLLRTAAEGGRSIGQVSRLDRDALVRIVESDAAARLRGSPAGDGFASDRFVTDGIARTRELDARGIDAVLRRAVSLLGLRAFLEEVAAPFLREVGEEWHAGRITPAHEHLASTVVQNIIVSAKQELATDDDAPGMVVATPAGERHAIGAALVAAAAAAEGWRVFYLGADLPAEDIAGAARATDARIVALSIVYVADEGVLDEVRRLRAALPADVLLLAGGAGALSLESGLEEMGVVVGTSLDGFRHAPRSAAGGRRRRNS